MEQTKINEILELHKKWLNGDSAGVRADLRCANLRDANLRDADLWNADLWNADLQGANVDYSCLPLWCGLLNIKIDRRIAAQLAYHFCAMQCDDPEVGEMQKSMYAFANTFHRVGEVPRLGEG